VQDTALPGRDTTSRTGDGGYLFGREFALFHLERMQQNAVENLYKSGHCLARDAQTPIPGLSNFRFTRTKRPLLGRLCAVLNCATQ
jgi:hypothetical protein